MSGFVNWLEHNAGKGLHAAGTGVSTAWKPFGYGFEKDTEAANWIAGQLLLQKIKAMQAQGVTMSGADAHLLNTYKQQGAGAGFMEATQGHPFIRFGAQTAYAPSTAIGGLAMLGPEVAGLRGIPAAMRAAGGGERALVAAQAADRVMALPFTLAYEGLTRPFRAGSVARKIPAIDHALQLSGESLAKISGRNLADWLNALKRSGHTLEEALGLNNPRLAGQMGPNGQAGLGPFVPTPGGGRPVAPVIPGQMTPTPPGAGAHTMGLGQVPYGQTAGVTVPNVPPSPAQVSGFPPTITPTPTPSEAERLQRTLAASQGMSNQELIDKLYERYGKATDPEVQRRILEAITGLENAPKPAAAEVVRQMGGLAPESPEEQIDNLAAQMQATDDPAEHARLFNEMERIQEQQAVAAGPRKVREPLWKPEDRAAFEAGITDLRNADIPATPELTREERTAGFTMPEQAPTAPESIDSLNERLRTSSVWAGAENAPKASPFAHLTDEEVAKAQEQTKVLINDALKKGDLGRVQDLERHAYGLEREVRERASGAVDQTVLDTSPGVAGPRTDEIIDVPDTANGRQNWQGMFDRINTAIPSDQPKLMTIPHDSAQDLVVLRGAREDYSTSPYGMIFTTDDPQAALAYAHRLPSETVTPGRGTSILTIHPKKILNATTNEGLRIAGTSRVMSLSDADKLRIRGLGYDAIITDEFGGTLAILLDDAGNVPEYMVSHRTLVRPKPAEVVGELPVDQAAPALERAAPVGETPAESLMPLTLGKPVKGEYDTVREIGGMPGWSIVEDKPQTVGTLKKEKTIRIALRGPNVGDGHALVMRQHPVLGGYAVHDRLGIVSPEMRQVLATSGDAPSVFGAQVAPPQAIGKARLFAHDYLLKKAEQARRAEAAAIHPVDRALAELGPADPLPATWEETHQAQNALKERMYALAAQADAATDVAEKTNLTLQAHELRDRLERLTEHSRVVAAGETAAARAAATGSGDPFSDIAAYEAEHGFDAAAEKFGRDPRFNEYVAGAEGAAFEGQLESAAMAEESAGFGGVSDAERASFYAGESQVADMPEPVRVSGVDEVDPPEDAPRSVLTRWDRRATYVHAAQQGNLIPILNLMRDAEMNPNNLMGWLKEVYGRWPGRYVKVGSLKTPGERTLQILEELLQAQPNGDRSALLGEAFGRATDESEAALAEAFTAMDPGQLEDVVTYLQSKRVDVMRKAGEPIPRGYQDMAGHEEIKQALKDRAINPDRPRLPSVSGGAQNAPINAFHAQQWYQRQSKFPGLALADNVVEGLREHEKPLVAALTDYRNSRKTLDDILYAAGVQHPTLNIGSFDSARHAVDTLKGLIPDQTWESLDRLVTRWEDYGIDLLHADAMQAIGQHTMTQVARELAPKAFTNRSELHRFMSETIPSAWKEQALLTPRYALGNITDIITKSLLHMRAPFGGLGLRREGTALVHEVPQGMQRYADQIGVEVPAALTDTGREALVGSPRGYVRNTNRESVYRNKWKNYNPVAWMSEANFSLAGAIETSARTGIWQQHSKDYFTDHGPRVVRQMLDVAGLPQPARERIERAFQRGGWDMAADKAEAIAVYGGVDPGVAKSFAGQWRNLAQAASDEGVRMSNHLHFDYAHRTNLDGLVGKIMPFHFWATRNIPFYLQHLSEHPQLAVAWMRYNRIAAEENKAQHLPARFRRFLSLGGNGIVEGLFGAPGVMGWNPSQAISITGQLDPGAEVNTEGMSAPMKLLAQMKAWTGLGVGPQADAIFNMTGLSGKRPHDPSFVRMGPFIEQMTGANPDLLVGRGMAKVRGALRGWDTESLSGSQYRDWQISRRILELAVEEGSGPNDPKYLLAINDPTSAIYKQAEGDVVQKAGALNLISGISPFTVKYASDTEVKVQEARDVLGQQYVPGESKEDREKRLAAQWAKDPQRSAMLELYDASGQTPLETELKRGLQYWSELKKAGWDNAPGKAKGEVYDLFYKRFPLVKEYFDYLKTKDIQGEEVPTGESFNEFFQYRKAVHPP